MTPMRRWPASERPRERMLACGPEGMTDAELLALVVGTSSRGSGGVLQTCRELLVRFGGLAGLARCPPTELTQVPGIGRARACAVAAAVELARRLEGSELEPGAPIRCAADVYRRLRPRLARRGHEVFLVLALDAKHRVAAVRQVAQGSATSVEVHPREVFAPLVREAAAAVIVAHNHPSGDPEPSAQDEQLTARLKRAGEVLGIPLLDHVIVGASRFVSLSERGLI
jgi:DNA repair protein RadC